MILDKYMLPCIIKPPQPLPGAQSINNIEIISVKMNNFAACAALLVVLAIVVSCSSSSGSSADASTDTREEPATTTLAAMATLTDAANACSKDNLAPLEKAVKDLDADLARIQADTNALAPGSSRPSTIRLSRPWEKLQTD